MKFFNATFSLFPLFAVGAFSIIVSGEPLPIGSSLPNAEMKQMDISGKEISFKDAMSKNGLLVMFSCNTCPVVKKYETRTVSVCKEAMTKGIGVVLLNSNEGTRDDGESFDDMKNYAKENGYNWFYALDKNSVQADAFGAARTPECFLFDKNGKLVYHGAIDNNTNESAATRNHLSIAMDELLAGKTISTATSKSVGCSIKRAN